MECEILLTYGTKMEYSPDVALTSGEDSASALEGSTPVRAYKKELRAAPFLFSAILLQPSITCSGQMSKLTRGVLNAVCTHAPENGQSERRSRS